MDSKKNVIGEVNVEVKAGLSVDKRTFRTYMDLVAIHAQNEGIKGMVVRFNDQDFDRWAEPLMRYFGCYLTKISIIIRLILVIHLGIIRKLSSGSIFVIFGRNFMMPELK